MGTHPIFESDFDCLTERKREWLRIRILSRKLTARWRSSSIQIRTQERKLSGNSKKFPLLMKCSLTKINVKLTIDSDLKDSKKAVVVEVSAEMTFSPCSSAVAPHSVVEVTEVTTDQEEAKMLVMNFVLLLKIFIIKTKKLAIQRQVICKKCAGKGG